MSSWIVMLIVSGILGWLGAVAIYGYAERLRLVQAPCHRSSHVRPMPNGGGLGIVLGGAVAGAWLAWGHGTKWWAVLGLGLVLAAVGLRNDISHLPARVRFGVQVAVCALLLAVIAPLPVIELPGQWMLGGAVLAVLILFAGVWWINLFNFMDGIDGIAGSQAVFMLAAAGLAVWMRPDVMADPTWLWMLVLAAATMGFLLLNWPPAKIFMGDVGSTYLGFMIFALALFSVQAGWMRYAAWLILGAAFISDATITLLRRMLAGERWFEAHRRHAYQRLSRRWHGDRRIGQRSVTLLTIAINVLWLAPLAWACLIWPDWALGWVALAYGPLVAGVVAVGAGRPDHA